MKRNYEEKKTLSLARQSLWKVSLLNMLNSGFTVEFTIGARQDLYLAVDFDNSKSERLGQRFADAANHRASELSYFWAY